MTPQKLILVVAELEGSLILLHQVLSRHGYDVVLAATAREALAQARRHHPDLVVMDPALVDEEGNALARRLREDPAIAEVPIAALSDASGLERALGEAGFCGIVRQRARLSELLASVQRCLGAGGSGLAWGGLHGSPA